MPYSHVFIADQIITAFVVLPTYWAVNFTTYLHLLEEVNIKVIVNQVLALRFDYNVNNYNKNDILTNLRLIWIPESFY